MTCDPWPVAAGCLPADWPSDVGQWTPAQSATRDVAQGILSALVVKPYGLCTSVVRPCARRCATAGGYLPLAGGWFAPALVGGHVVNGCGCTGAGCSCGPLSEVLLPGPVHAVTAVSVDGQPVPASAYRVDDGLRLVRVDGQTWPSCQRLDLPPTDAGTFAVEYQRGREVPAGAQRALAALMVELHKAQCGDQTCRLPAKVTSVVREGVTYSMLDDPAGLLDQRKTGIPEVDLWLAAENPYKARSAMGVWSPDLPNPRRQTWPAL